MPFDVERPQSAGESHEITTAVGGQPEKVAVDGNHGGAPGVWRGECDLNTPRQVSTATQRALSAFAASGAASGGWSSPSVQGQEESAGHRLDFGNAEVRWKVGQVVAVRCRLQQYKGCPFCK